MILQGNDVLLRMEKIGKYFPGVKALDGVDFDLRKGEVHALLGENGSGKSTLIKCLGGIYIKDAGKIFLDDKEVNIQNVHDSQALGVSIVHQELVLAPDMSVAENMYMGREPKNKFGLVDFKEMNRMARKVLDDFGEHSISTTTKMRELSVARQQVVEIAKALSMGARIVVMDEPTASLTQEEVEKLYVTIKQLRDMGVSIIYISHRMEELFVLSDRVTVFRDGIYIGTQTTKETNEDELVRMMVGRDVEMIYDTHTISDEVLLEVKNLTRHDKRVMNANIQLRKGEVLGVAGLVGAGRSEMARCIFGVDGRESGQIFLEGKELKIEKPTDAINQGIVLIPESRKEEGLVLIQSVEWNITLAVLNDFIKGASVNTKKENQIISDYFQRLNIKASSPSQRVGKLSGGNQQKVVLAKWLACKPKVLILDEPTRGIDVGAKAEIYALIDELAKEGVGIIVISSELPEIMRVSNRVIIMYEGNIVGELDKADVNEERIARRMTGVDRDEQ
jgi:ABC-type sugar transport system ATPase subunit